MLKSIKFFFFQVAQNYRSIFFKIDLIIAMISVTIRRRYPKIKNPLMLKKNKGLKNKQKEVAIVL